MLLKADDSPQSSPRVWDEQPPPPQKIDHDVRHYGGTTTAFDSMSSHMQPKKRRGSVQERVIELNQENGRLQHEALYYETLANIVLRNLLSSLQGPVSRLCSSIGDCKMAVEGQQLSAEATQQAENSYHTINMWSSRKTSQLCESSGCAQERTKKEASPFPILSPDHRTLPQSAKAREGSVLGVLVVRLTRENGKLRQSIALNRKLVFEVLVHLIPQLQHLTLGLRSGIDEGDVILKQANNAWGREISFFAQTCTDLDRGHSPDNKTSCQHIAKEGQDSTSSTGWIAQWPEHQGITESQNAISLTELRRHRRILQFECSSYRKLVEEVLVQVVPAIESHSNELQSIIKKSISWDHNIRRQFQERDRS